MTNAKFFRLLPTTIITTVLMLTLIFSMVKNADAVPVFTFDINDEGWINQVTEPFSVAFTPGEGFDGGGALAISGADRDSYQIVHAEDPDWSTTLSFFQQITFDVRLEPNVELNRFTTGMQIRDNIGNESNVYLLSNSTDLGGGWTRIFMEPTGLFDLPQSHDDVGLNLHLGTTGTFSDDSLVIVIDNISGGVPAAIPEPNTILFFISGLVGLVVLRRKKLKERLSDSASVGVGVDLEKLS